MTEALSDEQRYVYAECQEAMEYEELIGLDVAMSIAAWWHSPGKPNSTRLSTMGQVTCNMRMSDFASEDEYKAASYLDRRALEALDQFIQDAQNSGNAICNSDCE